MPAPATFVCVLLALGSRLLADDAAFFREKIEPLLRERCYECHSHAGKMKGGLTLDSRSGWVEGGESGPAIIPGKPDASLLIRAIRRLDEDLSMPPKKPLPPGEVALLTEWVRLGAPDPRTTVAKKPDNDWWSLKPLPGAGAQPALAKLGTENWEPGASPRTLIRRLYFDLHGLAPTFEEVEAFAMEWDRADPSGRALLIATLTDKLLASPRYGERWARHWFDTIHFADTHGFEHDRIRENAWRYRDYVIAALNADTPWPRFIREQLAADYFFPDEPRLTAALGFLGAGPFDQSAAGTAPKMFEAVDRDDMLTQTMAAFTSTTVGCARCHDHKFDPIPQREYYSLAAVFAGVAKGDIPFDADDAVGRERQRWLRLKSAAEKRDPAVLLAADARAITAAWEPAPGVPAVWETPAPRDFASAGGATLTALDDGSLLSGGIRPDKDTVTIHTDPKLRTISAMRLDVLTDDDLPKYGPGRQDNGNLHLSEFELYAIGAGDPQRVAIRSAFADFDQAGWTIAHALDGNEKTAWGIFPRVGEPHTATFVLEKKLALPAGARLRVVLKQLHGEGHLIGRPRISVTDTVPSPATSLPADVAAALRATPRGEAQQLTLAAYAVRTRATEALSALPPQALVYAAGRDYSRHGTKATVGEPREIRVLHRGELAQPRDIAAPAALACITALKPDFSSAKNEAARRAALADWIADPKNPLTWRSAVNRVWHYHFGSGIVDTPNDLGRMGGKPAHPELLDALAADFREHGSLKKLHRAICTSAAYRVTALVKARADLPPAESARALTSAATRRRLDAESYRDIVLQCAGRLDLTMGGPGAMHFKLGPAIQDTPVLDYTANDWDAPGANRRSIYRLVYRNIADPFMAALDFPDAAQLAPARPFSVSALQALALWNDNFILRMSEHFAARVEKMVADTPGRIRTAIRITLLREPTADELRDLSAFAEKHGLAALGRVLFNSNEFMFVE